MFSNWFLGGGIEESYPYAFSDFLLSVDVGEHFIVKYPDCVVLMKRTDARQWNWNRECYEYIGGYEPGPLNYENFCERVAGDSEFDSSDDPRLLIRLAIDGYGEIKTFDAARFATD